MTSHMEALQRMHDRAQVSITITRNELLHACSLAGLTLDKALLIMAYLPPIPAEPGSADQQAETTPAPAQAELATELAGKPWEFSPSGSPPPLERRMNVVKGAFGLQPPTDLADELRQLASLVDAGEVKQLVASYLQGDNYQFLFGANLMTCVFLSDLMHRRAMDNCQPGATR